MHRHHVNAVDSMFLLSGNLSVTANLVEIIQAEPAAFVSKLRCRASVVRFDQCMDGQCFLMADAMMAIVRREVDCC